MAEIFVQMLKEINIMQVAAIGIVIWFFYARIDRKIEKLDNKIEKLDNKVDTVKKDLEGKIDTVKKDLEAKIDTLGNKVEDVDRRLYRIEGSLAT